MGPHNVVGESLLWANTNMCTLYLSWAHVGFSILIGHFAGGLLRVHRQCLRHGLGEWWWAVQVRDLLYTLVQALNVLCRTLSSRDNQELQ